MATISISSLGELLKRLYAPWEIEQLVNLTFPVLNECARKGSAQLGGSGFYFPVRVFAASGHAYIAETGDLPTGYQSKVLQATASPVVHAGVVQLSGLSMAVSSSNAMAFARGFDENVQQTIESMSAYKEGTLFRSGTGLLTRFNGDPGTTTDDLTVDDTGYLRPGMWIDVVDDSDTTPTARTGNPYQISVVDWINKDIGLTVSSNADFEDNDRIFVDSAQPQDASAMVTREPFGFGASLTATGSYLGIARGDYGAWQANLMTASAFLDEDILLRARTRVTQVTGLQLGQMAGRFKVLCHPMQVDTLFKLAIPRIRYAGGDAFDLGNRSNVSFGGMDFVTSYQCPPGTAYMGDFSYSQSLYTPNGELHVDNEYNGSSLKWVASKDVGLVFAKEYHQFVVKRPNAFIVISSLTENTR